MYLIWCDKFPCRTFRTWTTLTWVRVLLGVVTGLQEALWAPLHSTESMEVISPPDPRLQPARPPRESRPLCLWTCPRPAASVHHPPLLEALGRIWTRRCSSTSLPASCRRVWIPARERLVQGSGSGANGTATWRSLCTRHYQCGCICQIQPNPMYYHLHAEALWHFIQIQ